MKGPLPKLARNGHGVMSDLSPLCGQEQTLSQGTTQPVLTAILNVGPVRRVG